MPHPEFEAYLALLSRFLRLNAAQRDEIRRELRAHLEEAIEEQTARGVPREQAILRALDDFGDAAELAARFSDIGRARRWIMRGTLAAACIGFMVLTINFLSPATRPVAAQSQQAAGGGPDPLRSLGYTGGPAKSSQTPDSNLDPLRSLGYSGGQASAGQKTGTSQAREGDAAITAALKSRGLPEANFEDVPFDQVVEFLRELLGVNVHVQWNRLAESGVGRDRPVNLKLKNIPAERLLRLVLDEVGGADANLGYEVQEGILVISTRETLDRRLTTQTYDVRNLLTAARVWRERTGAKPRAGLQAQLLMSMADAKRKNDAAKDAANAPKAPAKGGEKTGETLQDQLASACLNEWTPEEELLQVLEEVVQPDSWGSTGGQGSTCIFNGILIVRQTESVQREIEQFLSNLRKAGADQVASAGATAEPAQASAGGAGGPR